MSERVFKAIIIAAAAACLLIFVTVVVPPRWRRPRSAERQSS
jgi:hypothetical protein